MQGYAWAQTPDNELLVVLVMGGKGYVPGREGAIDLEQITILEPVQWPHPIAPASQISDLSKSGALVPDAMPECVILHFAANA